MQTGQVLIDFEKLKKDYPFSTNHILNMLSSKKNVSYEVKEEDNEYYDPTDNQFRVRLSYTDTESNEEFFTLLLDAKYICFKEN